MLPNRWGSTGSYRYGFNGKEMDDEVKGQGLQYDYGFRIYDPRLGKFLSMDPLTDSYPWYTPYQFAGNNPITFIDLDGLEEASPEIKTNVIIFIETDFDLLEKTERNSTSMQNWKVIYASNITDASEQFHKYTGGEKVVENLVIRSHGAPGYLLLDANIAALDDEGNIKEYEPIFTSSADLVRFNHPRAESNSKDFMITQEGWTEEQYENVVALVSLGDDLIDNANVVITSCDSGTDFRIGQELRDHYDANVIVNLGKGALSGYVTRTVGDSKVETLELIVPGFVASENHRDKGFMLFPINGEPEKKGAVEIKDDKEKPLVIPPKS